MSNCFRAAMDFHVVGKVMVLKLGMFGLFLLFLKCHFKNVKVVLLD